MFGSSQEHYDVGMLITATIAFKKVQQGAMLLFQTFVQIVAA